MRPLSYAKITNEFTRTDSVFAIDEYPESRKPLVQNKRRILKSGSGLQRELGLHVSVYHFPKPDFWQDK